MKIIKAFVMKGGTVFAIVALMAAQVASTQFSLIYYQDSVSEKVRSLRDRYIVHIELDTESQK